MKQKLLVLSLVSLLLVLGAASVLANDLNGYYNLQEYEELTGQKLAAFNEAPDLEEKVKSGELQSVADRLPENPLVQIPWVEVGQYGGTLRWDEFTTDYDHFLRHLITSDLVELPPSSQFHVYNNLNGPVQPGVFSEWEMGPEGKVFTFKIREGIKWSDGVEVTTEDVEYFINDVLKNEDITPVPPKWLNWGGELAQIDVVDKYTFRLEFAKSYGSFINTEMNEGHWSSLIRPKHYVKKFHKDYTDWDQILPIMEERGYTEKDEWGTFYSEVDTAATGGNLIKVPYPEEYPTLNPYIVTEVKDNGDWVFERNPYFYMVDTAGNQLPYIDKLYRTYISNKEMVNMDIIQGKTDLQGQFIQLADYPLYKKNEEKGGYKVLPLPAWQDQMLMYWFNLEVDDEVFPTEVIKDKRFRQALSLALNREQIKESVFLDFGNPSQLSPNPGTPYYEEDMAQAYASYDPEQAKALLDEMGVKDADGNGWREWNGEELIIPILYYEVTPPATPGSEMAKRYWEDIGIRVQIKQVNGNFFWERQGANKVLCAIWWLGGANLTDPFWHYFNVNVPEWWQWYETNGEQGTEPPAWAKKNLEARDIIFSTSSDEERLKAGKTVWENQAEQVYLIGTVAHTPTPFIYNANLGNVGVAQERRYASITVMEAATQWYFQE